MTSLNQPLTAIDYPDSDGKPMAEGDIQCDYLIYARSALRAYFQPRPNVYVAGNLLIYYEEGNPKVSVAPDVFVVFGVSNRKRPIYKTWEEGKGPDFVLEITSKTTRREDQRTKPGIYARLGVQEYFQYDPTGDYLRPQLQGRQWVDGEYRSLPLLTHSDGSVAIVSRVLGLELQLHSGDLRFFDPSSNTTLPTREELEQALVTTEQTLATTEQTLATTEQTLATTEQTLVTTEQTLATTQQMLSQAEQAILAAEEARLAAEAKAQALAERLRQLGLDPEQL